LSFLFFQDLIQGTPPLSPMLSCPLPTAQHVQYLKHQGKNLSLPWFAFLDQTKRLCLN